MKFNKAILIFSVVVISLLAVSAVSASDNATDVVEVADESDAATVETYLNDDASEILAENDVEESVVSIDEDDAQLSENESSQMSEITIYSNGEQVTAFNFTKANGTYDFGEILQMLNQSDMNMSNFGNFFDMFSNFNFTGENKTFDFNIDGDVNDIQYNLKLVSNPQNFVFNYIIKSPNMGPEFNNITSNNLSVYADGNFLTNISFNTNVLGIEDLMKMFNATGFENMNLQDMMSQFNFTDMASQFGNSTFTEDSNRTFNFKIDGEVGNVKYDLLTISNATDFVFDYKINYKQLQVVIETEGLKVSAVDTKIDGEVGKYLTFTLKDQFGRALSDKKLYVALDNEEYNLTTDADGKAQLQVNIAKAGIYTAAITFIGDNSYSSQFKAEKVVVKKQKAKLAVKKASYKTGAKSKKVKATFKSAYGNALKNKKITFKVKDKTYKAKTNSKGVATINVKLAKKGTYKVTAKFAGDDTYKKVIKTAKLVLK